MFQLKSLLTAEEAEIQKRFEKTEQLIQGSFKAYYHEVDPKRLTALWNRLIEADKRLAAAGNPEGVIAAFDEFIGEIERDKTVLGSPITETQIKQVHATKTKNRVSDGEYRVELMRLNAETSKTLTIYEAKLLINRLNKKGGSNATGA